MPSLSIILPVGISFYTFQSMSYTIDVYRKNSKAYTDYFLFSSYVCFFPQLIAGPIIRHNELVDQIKEACSSKINFTNISFGIHFFVLGLAKKILIADRISAAIDPALMIMDSLNSLEGFLCALGYTFQLYFDFSGYSDMAIGLGYFFNLKFPQNFNSPYKSKSITEFWRRWHITLSSWLRDYLYISLGGNRSGKFKTYRNLFLTMLLGGLWHGAGWTYVFWGAYHGIWLIIERLFKGAIWRKTLKPLQVILTFITVLFGWIFFRSPDLSFAFKWIKKILIWDMDFKISHFPGSTKDRFFGILIISLIILFRRNTTELIEGFNFSNKKSFLYALLLFISLIYLSSESPFLYFQF